MMKTVLLAALALTTVEAATKVAVIELGPSGSVHRTSSRSTQTSPQGVTSFFNALHGGNGKRKLQHSGMTVVPDLFSKPESGVVVSVSGADLDSMPKLDFILSNEESEGVVGHMECPGKQSQAILKNVNNIEEVESSSLNEKVKAKAMESGLSGVSLSITSENASDVDAEVAEMINDMKKSCHDAGKRVVIHLLVEEEQGAARRRLTSRNLQDDEEGQDGENNDMDGYFAHGYYNSYGEWVTSYKTIFQIQYFNVVTWTSVVLVGVLFYSFGMMLNMPLMPDTLLFGESAKVPLDD